MNGEYRNLLHRAINNRVRELLASNPTPGVWPVPEHEVVGGKRVRRKASTNTGYIHMQRVPGQRRRG